jgi:hypothetical protein
MTIYSDKCTVTLNNVFPADREKFTETVRRYYPKAVVFFVEVVGVSYPDGHPKRNN